MLLVPVEADCNSHAGAKFVLVVATSFMPPVFEDEAQKRPSL